MAAFGPGQIVINLRSRVTEEVLTAGAETTGNAADISSLRHAGDEQLTKQLAWHEAKSRIGELREVGIDVNGVAPIESGHSGASIVDEARRKQMLQTQDPVLPSRRG